MKKYFNVIIPAAILTIVVGLFLGNQTKEENRTKVVDNATTQKLKSEKTVPLQITPEKEKELLKEEISSARLSIAAIRNYSQKIYLSADEKVALKSNLMNEATRAAIKEHLVNPTYLQENQFTKRIHALDALYEGLKLNDSEVREAYLNLVMQTLSYEPSPEVLSNKKLHEQFFGDRVEIALILQKMEGPLAHTVQMQSQPASDKYFERAKEISSTYQVAL